MQSICTRFQTLWVDQYEMWIMRFSRHTLELESGRPADSSPLTKMSVFRGFAVLPQSCICRVYVPCLACRSSCVGYVSANAEEERATRDRKLSSGPIMLLDQKLSTSNQQRDGGPPDQTCGGRDGLVHRLPSPDAGRMVSTAAVRSGARERLSACRDQRGEQGDRKK